MAALIKAAVLSRETINLVPQRTADIKVVSPKAAPLNTVAVGAGDIPMPASTEGQAALQQSSFSAAEKTVDGGVDAEDTRYDENLTERLNAQKALLIQARQQAAADAYVIGLEEGRQAGAKEYTEAVASLRQILDASRESMSSVLEESEQIIATIVFESVCRIIGKTLPSAEACALVVKEVVSRVARDEILSVRISPNDYAQIDALASGSGGGGLTFPGISIESDEAVELGGCILTLKGGTIDGRIETQFRSFAQSLKDAARRN